MSNSCHWRFASHQYRVVLLCDTEEIVLEQRGCVLITQENLQKFDFFLLCVVSEKINHFEFFFDLVWYYVDSGFFMSVSPAVKMNV